MAGVKAGIEPAVKTRFGELEIYACGPWCQGPMLLQALSLLDGPALRSAGHNSVAYIHTLVEALKLAFADRERWYGDPRFVDVPVSGLLSPEYAALRRKLIDPNRAAPG